MKKPWHSLNFEEIKLVFQKELKESLRDTRTIFIMVAVPVLIYPVMTLSILAVVTESKKVLDKEMTRVAIVGQCPALTDFLRAKKDLVVSEIKADEAENVLKTQKQDVVIELPASLELDPEIIAREKVKDAPKVTLKIDATQSRSIFKYQNVDTYLRRFQRQAYRQFLDKHQIDDRWTNRLKPIRKDISSSTELSGAMLGTSVPYVLIFMILAGTVYASLDLITREREIGTLPLLLTSPVERHSIMWGKALVVMLAGITEAVLGLMSLAVSVAVAMKAPQFGIGSSMNLSIEPTAILVAILLSLPLALFLSGCSILVAAYARSYQQGQGYFTGLLLVFLVLPTIATLPEVKLASLVAFIPVSNVSVCMRDVLAGKYDWPWIFITFLTSALSAGCLVALAIRFLDNESLLFGIEQSPERKKREGRLSREAAGFFAFVFLLLFYLGQLAQTWNLVWGMIISQVGLIAAPGFALLRFLKLSIAETLSLRKPHWRHLLGAALLAPATVVAGHLLVELQNVFLPIPETFNKMFIKIIVDPQRPLWLTLFIAALLPGICEELLFRGVFQGLLSKRFPPGQLVAIIGLMFGAFHMSMFRILPTGLLGVLLSYIVILTGSIYPAMVLHACHNALSIALSYYQFDPPICWVLMVSGICLGAASFLLKPRDS